VSGILLNDPIFDSSLRVGDRISEPLSLVEDWLYAIEGKVYGGFTVDVLRSRMSSTELKKHDSAWGNLEFGLPGKVFVLPSVTLDSKKHFRAEDTLTWPEHPKSDALNALLESLIKERPSLVHDADETGRTILHNEVLKGSTAVVAGLLKLGADPLVRDKKGISAKDLAEKLAWNKIVCLFEKEPRKTISSKLIVAFLITDIGKIKVELDAGRAPKTVAHFLECVKAGFYDNTLCNRIFDFSVFFALDSKLEKKVFHHFVESEATNGLKNLRYTLAMSLTTKDPGSAAGGFFINLDDNDILDYDNATFVGYTVFGKVTEGFDVLENIRTANTLKRCSGHEKPIKAVVLEKIHVVATQLRRAKI
jgi:cyclophilin family peptidyl-prolyl cis-trans isomerase